MKEHKHHMVPKHKGGVDEDWNLEEIDFITHAEIHANRYLQGLDRQFDYRHEGWRYLSTELRDAVRAEHSRRFKTEENPNYRGKNYVPMSPEKKKAISEIMKINNPHEKSGNSQKSFRVKEGKTEL